MSNDAPHGAQAPVIPLPEARQLRRAIESLGTGHDVHRKPGARQHPMGERAEAAQLLGVLKGLVGQIEYGLYGGPLHEGIQAGLFAAYDRNIPALLAAESARAQAAMTFATQGIHNVPHASQQMAATALGLNVAFHGFAAASQIALGLDSPEFDGEEVVKQTKAMYEWADELTDYVATKRAQHDADDA